MYVWRIPIVLGADLVVAATLLALSVSLLGVRRSLSKAAGKGVLSASIVLTFVLSPLVVDGLVQYRQRQGLHATYIDPSPLSTLVPAIFVFVVLVTAYIVFRNIAFSGTGRYRFIFYSSAVVFFGLNVINSCSPGWCERFGFPFAYSSWSDAVLSFNGNVPSPWSPVGAGFDLLAAGAAIFAFARYVRHRVESATAQQAVAADVVPLAAASQCDTIPRTAPRG